MGAEHSVLDDVEAVDGSYDCSKSSDGLTLWTTVFPGHYAHQRVTVFLKETGDDGVDDDIAKFDTAVKHLKQIRHPSILRYVNCSVSRHQLCLLTERAQPLAMAAPELSAIEIQSGLDYILAAMLFLHNQIHLSHGNICLENIFVAVDSSWKLGNFQSAIHIKQEHWTDLLDFCLVIEDLFDVCSPELTANTSMLELRRFGAGITAKSPASGSADDLKRIQNLLRNDLSEILEFLTNLPMKTDQEKDFFFDNAPKKLRRLPVNVIGRTLVKPFLSRFVLLEPGALKHVLPNLVCPKNSGENEVVREFADRMNSQLGIEPLLPVDLFQKYVVKELVKIFLVHETCVRLTLLSLFQRFVYFLDETILRSVVLPELLLGMKDSNEQIVAASFRCLADVVPLLGPETVTGMVHKKYFTEGQPRSAKELKKELTSFNDVKTVLLIDSDVKSTKPSNPRFGAKLATTIDAKCTAETKSKCIHDASLDTAFSSPPVQQPCISAKINTVGVETVPIIGDSDILLPISGRFQSMSEQSDVEDSKTPDEVVDDKDSDWSDSEWGEGAGNVQNDVIAVNSGTKAAGISSDAMKSSARFIDIANSSNFDRKTPDIRAKLISDWSRNSGQPVSNSVKLTPSLKIDMENNNCVQFKIDAVKHSSPSADKHNLPDGNSRTVIPNSSPSSINRHKSQTSRNSESLGAEFEIQAITTDSERGELDFFADMQPSIKLSNEKLKPASTCHGGGVANSGNKFGNVSKFQLVENMSELIDAVDNNWEDSGWD